MKVMMRRGVGIEEKVSLICMYQVLLYNRFAARSLEVPFINQDSIHKQQSILDLYQPVLISRLVNLS